MKKQILVLDDTIFNVVIKDVLTKRDYPVEMGETVERMNELLAQPEKFSLLVADYKFLQKANPEKRDTFFSANHPPVIYTTEEDIDNLFDFILKNNINLILNKPFKGPDFANIVDKLLNPNALNWFGLQNYLPGIKRAKSLEITKSTQIRTAIAAVLQICEEWGFHFEMKFEMDLVWQEIMTNALYHSHGYTEYKEKRIPIRLPEGYRVDVRFAANDAQFGISVRDYCGTLTPAKIIQSIARAIEQQNLLERSVQTGEDVSELISDGGRGLDLLRRMSGEYYFIIDPGKSTEVIIIYDTFLEKDDPYSSIRIFELPKSAGVSSAQK